MRGTSAAARLPRPAAALRPAQALALHDPLLRLLAAPAEPEVLAVALGAACTLAGGRAAAFAELLPDGSGVIVLGSTGYDCTVMAAGAVLPADSGLPLCTAVAQGRRVVQGEWVALPTDTGVAPAGLLVSLGPDADHPDVELLAALAEATGAAVRRTRASGLGGGARIDPVPGLDAAAVVRPLADAASGDVVELVADGSGGGWLVVADVCGSGRAAAPLAAALRLAVRAAVPHAAGPAALLRGLDAALGGERFVTACAVRLRPAARGFAGTAAVAGHPPPLIWRPVTGRAAYLSGSGSPPLGLRLGGPLDPVPRERVFELAPGDVLLAHTDGLTDRIPALTDGALPKLLAAAAPAGPAAAVLDRLEAALADTAPRDDVAAAVVRVTG